MNNFLQQGMGYPSTSGNFCPQCGRCSHCGQGNYYPNYSLSTGTCGQESINQAH